jgi:excisionase family DNA binding protein
MSTTAPTRILHAPANATPSSRTNARNEPQPTRDSQTLASLLADRHAKPHSGEPNAPPRTGNHSTDPECITADELATLMGVNRKTVYEYAARNVIPCRRLGRRLVFSLPAIRAWLARSSGSDPAPSLPVSSRRR